MSDEEKVILTEEEKEGIKTIATQEPSVMYAILEELLDRLGITDEVLSGGMRRWQR